MNNVILPWTQECFDLDVEALVLRDSSIEQRGLFIRDSHQELACVEKNHDCKKLIQEMQKNKYDTTVQ